MPSAKEYMYDRTSQGTMNAITQEPHIRVVEAPITYVSRSSKINRRWVSPGLDINTGTYETHLVSIRDGRPIQERFKLHEHGFQLISHTSAVADFSDRQQIDAVYPKEAERVLLQLTGASRFAPMSWMMRGSDAVPGGPIQQPASEAHVDISHDRALSRAHSMYEKAFPGGPGFSRFIALSYWRCLSPPPQDWPLALCDFESSRDTALAEAATRGGRTRRGRLG